MLDIQKILKKDCTYIIQERVLNLQKDDFGKFYIKKNIAVKKKAMIREYQVKKNARFRKLIKSLYK